MKSHSRFKGEDKQLVKFLLNVCIIFIIVVVMLIISSLNNIKMITIQEKRPEGKLIGKVLPKIIYQETLMTPIQIKRFESVTSQSREVLEGISDNKKCKTKENVKSKGITQENERVSEERKHNKVFSSNIFYKNMKRYIKRAIMLSKMCIFKIKRKSVKDRDTKELKTVKKEDAKLAHDDMIEKIIKREKRKLKFEKENREWRPYQTENKIKNKLKKKKTGKENKEISKPKEMRKMCKREIKIKIKKLSVQEVNNWNADKTNMNRDDQENISHNEDEWRKLMDEISNRKKKVEEKQRTKLTPLVREEIVAEVIHLMKKLQILLLLKLKNYWISLFKRNNQININTKLIQEFVNFQYTDEDLSLDRQLEKATNILENQEIETSSKNIVPTSNEYANINKYLDEKIENIIESTEFNKEQNSDKLDEDIINI